MPVVVGVPEIRPVVELSDRPVGSPVAVYVRAPPLVVLAWICRLAAVPTTVDWLAGAVTVTGEVETRLPTPIAAQVLATVLYVALPAPHSAAAACSDCVRAEA